MDRRTSTLLRRWLGLFALVLVLLAIFPPRWLGWLAVEALVRDKFPSVRSIRPGELAGWLRDPHRPAPLLLDVREPAEFKVSHLVNARPVEPTTDPAALHLLPNQPIVTYCSVGYRSAAYAQRLQQAGFTNVRNLEGSIFRWAAEGRPLVRDGQPVKQVHPYNATWGLLIKPSLRAKVPPAG